MHITRVAAGLLLAALALAPGVVARAEEKTAEAPAPIRAGMIGLDTSHATAFFTIFNDPQAIPEIKAIKIVAGYPAASDDLPTSRDRVKEYTEQLRKQGVEIVDSIPALLAKVDVVMIESIDGRKHLEQVRPVFESGKLVFIDKPLTASLADAIAIAELGKKHNVAWFTSSALRFSPGIASMRRDPKLGEITGCDAWSPCSLDPTHPDLFWYGIHGVETLFTVMGPGCVSVSRTTTPDTDQATGVWSDGRIGTFRGIRKGKHDFGATAFGTKGVASSISAFTGYQPLMVEIAKFFQTGKAPITPDQTLEIIAFMEAAEESKRQEGKPVTMASVMERARAEASSRSR